MRQLNIDRQSGEFERAIAALKPDVVIDLICYSLESAQKLVEALRGTVQQFLHCGTIWVHGPGIEVPTTEEQPRRPISDYGRRKAWTLKLTFWSKPMNLRFPRRSFTRDIW